MAKAKKKAKRSSGKSDPQSQVEKINEQIEKLEDQRAKLGEKIAVLAEKRAQLEQQSQDPSAPAA